jgi:membrane-associated phospholipid phosphatase
MTLEGRPTFMQRHDAIEPDPIAERPGSAACFMEVHSTATIHTHVTVITIMRARFVLLLGLLVSGSPAVQAQSVGRMLVDDVGWAARDIAAIFASPFKGSKKDYLIAGGVLAASAALSPLDDNVDRWAAANRDRGILDAIKPVRSGGDFYSLNKATPYVAGLYVVGLATKHRGLRDGIFGCAAAYTANTTIRHQVVYRLIGRDRPDTVRHRPEGETGPPAREGDQFRISIPADGWRSHSFPGGHVATMATCASFFAHRFDAPYIDPVLIALVSAMGVGRIADRGHWLSDQTVGVAFGYAVGKEVARRQLRRLASEGDGATESAGEPYIDAGAHGVVVGYRRTF